MLPYQGLFVVAFVAFVVELVSFIANRYFVNPAESFEEKRLTLEAKRLRAEAKTLEGSPATFMEFAKVGREATTCEKRADELRLEREGRKSTPAGKLASQIAYFLFPLSMVFAYFFWTSFVSEMEPVLRVPEVSWVWPMAHMIALPNQPPNGSVSSVGWMWVCRRVFARLLDLAVPL